MHAILSKKYQNPPQKIFIIGCLLATIPIWLVKYLPMIDLPQHAAQVATLIRLISGQEYFSSYYKIVYITPYWFAYAFTALLSCLMPITMALKCVISFSVILTAWASAKLRSLVSQDNSIDWLFLPIGYGFSFEWGFLTYMLSVPLALLSLRYFLDYLFFPTKKKMWYSALYAFVLFFAHAISYIAIIFIVVTIECLTTNNVKTTLKKIWPFFSPCILILKWLFYVSNSWSFTIIIDNFAHHINYRSFVNLLGAYYADSIKIAITLILSVFFLLFRVKFILNWQIIPFTIICIMVLLGPNIVLDTLFFSERLSVFLLPFFVFFIRFEQNNLNYIYKIRYLSSLFISIVLLFITGHKIYMFNATSALIDRVLNKIEPNKKLFSVVNSDIKSDFSSRMFVNIGAWYRSEKNGISDPSFASYPSFVITYNKQNYKMLFWKNNLSYEDYKKGNHLKYYDYFLFIGDKSKVNNFIKMNSLNIKPVYEENNWWVLKKI